MAEKAAFYGYPEMAEVLACGERHIANLVTAGTIPKPIKLGRLVRWPVAEIDAWVESGCPDAKKWSTMKKECK